MDSKVKQRFGGFTKLVIRGGIFLGAPALTVWLLNYLAKFADGFVGSAVRTVGRYFLTDATMQSPVTEFFVPYLSLVVLVLILAGFGVVASYPIGKRGLRLIDQLVLLIPGVNRIYEFVRKVLDLLGSEDEAPKFSRTVFYCPKGGHPEVGFVANEFMDGDEKILVIFNPIQTPNPIGGRIIWIPERETEPTNLTVAASIQHLVSMGAATPGELKVAFGRFRHLQQTLEEQEKLKEQQES